MRVRVAAGVLKGLQLSVPRHIRATEGKVRQAVFNILGERVAGARVLDGFAGSGALGLEALSRGASLVVFLESHPLCLKAIRENLAHVPPSVALGRWTVRAGDVLRNLAGLAGGTEAFDLILLDPPYEGGWGKKSLNVVAECAILARAGLLCLEHARQSEPPAKVGCLVLRKQHRYGETVLSFYQGE